MKHIEPITVNVDAYLASNKYSVDEDHPHIVMVDEPSDEEFDKLVLVCPAALYKRDAEGNKTFDHAGCLECGTCRVVSLGKALSRWEFPQPTMGIEYRQG